MWRVDSTGRARLWENCTSKFKREGLWCYWCCEGCIGEYLPWRRLLRRYHCHGNQRCCFVGNNSVLVARKMNNGTSTRIWIQCMLISEFCCSLISFNITNVLLAHKKKKKWTHLFKISTKFKFGVNATMTHVSFLFFSGWCRVDEGDTM